MFYIGLTGGIASGKSAVLNCFAELGAATLSADQIAREVVMPGSPTLDTIARHFGGAILLPTGELNRAALREIISRSEAERRWLESIMHPAITARSSAYIQETGPTSLYLVHEIPLLSETRKTTEFSRILTVDVAQNVQRQRALARGNISEHQLDAFISAQASAAERRQIALDIIQNNGTMDELRCNVQRLHRLYLWLRNRRA
ncbi:MAG: dephospho-CoA kinase [Gammaproteobacteria bacterium]|nr:dephospho-CoA kinase [Gammaproteobacteria bacterium]